MASPAGPVGPVIGGKAGQSRQASVGVVGRLVGWCGGRLVGSVWSFGGCDLLSKHSLVNTSETPAGGVLTAVYDQGGCGGGTWVGVGTGTGYWVWVPGPGTLSGSTVGKQWEISGQGQPGQPGQPGQAGQACLACLTWLSGCLQGLYDEIGINCSKLSKLSISVKKVIKSVFFV